MLGWLLALTLVVGDLWPGAPTCADSCAFRHSICDSLLTVRASLAPRRPTATLPRPSTTAGVPVSRRTGCWSCPVRWWWQGDCVLPTSNGAPSRNLPGSTAACMCCSYIVSSALQACVQRGDVAVAQRVLRETGCEALAESASWLILRRARRFELPLHCGAPEGWRHVAQPFTPALALLSRHLRQRPAL